MEMTSRLLTVIVPVYNVEKYLAQCLDSLAEQTVCDHKVIVVNDGTKDSSGEIAKAYAARYPHMIRYVEQENQGLGAARNTGLALADTEYVTFLDSDDWWDRLFVEKLQAQLALHQERPDMIFTLPWIYDQVTGRVTDWFDKAKFEEIFFPEPGEKENPVSRVVNAAQDRRLFELEPSACRRVYRLQFLRGTDFSFPVGVKWEDIQPHFQALHKAKSCIGLGCSGFFYRTNSGGQITTGRGAARMDMIPVFDNILKMAESEHWSQEERVYILRALWIYAKWSIFVTNADYLMPLLKGLHKLFRSIPRKDLKAYFETCSPDPTMERILAFELRTPLYGLLKDYLVRWVGVCIWDRIQMLKGK